jgi:hypothetical protein
MACDDGSQGYPLWDDLPVVLPDDDLPDDIPDDLPDDLPDDGSQGYPLWEQSVFELLAQCVAPLVGIFGYYARSSLGHFPLSLGFVELNGWNDFILDCNAITKSFSGFRAAEVFMDAPKVP